MTPLRLLWRGLRLGLRTVGGLWSVLMMLLMAGSLALSVAMAVIPAVFSAVSGVVETATGARTLRQRQVAREAALADDVARAERRAAAATRRADDLARELAGSRAAERRLARELADSPVVYRGERTLAREAVKDTATRVSGRLRVATARNITSMAGEALPVVGIGVVAAATAWEIHDTCALMGEMRELDAAFNPGDPVSDDEICGITPPTRAELWEMVRASPSAAWQAAQQMYAGLPDPLLSGAYGRVSGWFGAAGDDTAEDAPPPPAGPPPAAPDHPEPRKGG